MPLMYNEEDQDEKAARALKREMDLALRFDTNNDPDFRDQRKQVDRQKQAKRLKKMQKRQRKAS